MVDTQPEASTLESDQLGGVSARRIPRPAPHVHPADLAGGVPRLRARTQTVMVYARGSILLLDVIVITIMMLVFLAAS